MKLNVNITERNRKLLELNSNIETYNFNFTFDNRQK